MRHDRCIRKGKRQGIALFAAMIFMVVFMAMAAAMLTMSSTNLQTTANHQEANAALNAALSGLEIAKYHIHQCPTFETVTNTVSAAEADLIWEGNNGHGGLYGRLIAANLAGKSPNKNKLADREEIETGPVKVKKENQNNGQGNAWAWGHFKNSKATYNLRFIRYDDDPLTIYVQSIGQDEENSTITRTVQMEWNITKSADVLQYAIAGRGRMWLAGDTTIYGSIYSSYGKKSNGTLLSMSPFNMTGDARVEGTVNTILTQAEVGTRAYQLETLTADGKPQFEYGTSVYDAEGNAVAGSYGPCDDTGYLTAADGSPVYDETGMRIPVDFANRLYSGDDELLGYHEGVNYGQPNQSNIPGLSIADYDTDMYYTRVQNGGGNIYAHSSPTQYNGSLETFNAADSGKKFRYEYFPHDSDSYTSGSGLKLKRWIYKNQTFTDVNLPSNKNAVFINCTFNGVLYVDCAKNTNNDYNNVRFEDCNFNGVIVTDTPSALSWQKNALYFTGSSTFDNQSDVQEATILAPHFNVNLGNANNGEVQTDENIITGAVVGGIVDVRGNAQVNGTIISMADTTSYTSGYVTNIGATLGDGGSETTAIEDIGTIEITPNPDQMLPSGITTPIVINPIADSYAELRCSD